MAKGFQILFNYTGPSDTILTPDFNSPKKNVVFWFRDKNNKQRYLTRVDYIGPTGSDIRISFDVFKLAWTLATAGRVMYLAPKEAARIFREVDEKLDALGKEKSIAELS